jgi:hypothetical protein
MEVLPMLSGTFDLFPLAEVLGLIERAAASGALVVRGREVDGALYFVSGELSGGEVADLSGPVADREELDVRLLEVCVSLLRSRNAEFDFRADETPPWPAAVTIPVDAVLPRATEIARDWPAIMSAVESFESMLERSGALTVDSVTLSALAFRLLELVDGQTTIRDLAHQAQASLIVVAPEVRTLILSGAVRVLVDAERALATARAGADIRRPASTSGVVDVTEPTEAPVPMPAAATAPAGTPAPPAPVAPPSPVHAPAPNPAPTYEPVPVAAASVETMHPATDPAELARERADLAARAGLGDPGPGLVPTAETPAGSDEGAAPERSQIVVDRSDLLRMFSGLKE